jgi:Winged helix DNA-binding domain
MSQSAGPALRASRSDARSESHPARPSREGRPRFLPAPAPWHDPPMRVISDLERCARLARRHRLAPGHRAGDVVEAATSMVCLHGTDPATVYLSARARVDDLTVPGMDRSLYADRSLVKHLAMRGTIFVFPRDALPFAQAGASTRVAGQERRRLIREVEKAGLYRDGESWLADATGQVLEALSDGREATSSELRDELPLLEGSMSYGEGKSWGGAVPVGPRVLTVLSAAGDIVRASNDGGWAVSRPRWTSMKSWVGEEIERLGEAEGVAGLVERWLRAFGPGTEADVKWWLGSTVTAVRRALADLEAVEVDVGGATGYVLPDDVDAPDPVEPWGALLPPLDPTTMGWFERDWYLGPYRAQLFDTNGNAGPTTWWEGRIVGGWRQDDEGAVELQMLEDIGSEGLEALTREAERLTEWFGGTRVLPRFPSPLSKEIARG